MFRFPARPERRAFSLLLILSVAVGALALGAVVARPAYAGSHAAPAAATQSSALAQPPAAGIPHRGGAAPAPRGASRAAAPNVAPQPLDAAPPLAPPSGDDSGLWLLGAGLALLLLLEAVSLGLAARAGA